jgi:hypothetical protein
MCGVGAGPNGRRLPTDEWIEREVVEMCPTESRKIVD